MQEAKASSILATGGVDLWAIGSHLRSKHGYLIALRRANVVQRPKAYLRQLRHDFLVVRGLQPTSEGCPPEVLVDLNFRDHFRVAHATPWYTKLLAALPQDWVGSAQALAPLVGLMSAGEEEGGCLMVGQLLCAGHNSRGAWDGRHSHRTAAHLHSYSRMSCTVTFLC